MEEEEQELTRVFQKPLSVKELDVFYEKVSMDLGKEMNDPGTHMIFQTDYHRPKKHNQIEMTPMLHFRGRLMSAQRISYFIMYGKDVGKISHLFLRCGESNCINPYHLIYLPTKEERNEYINK